MKSGYGVFGTAPDATADDVAKVISVGYRLIDTAVVYQNEH